MDAGLPNLRRHFKDGVLVAGDDVCWKKRWRRSTEDTWWWNEEVKEALSRKKDAHVTMCQNNTEENKRRCKITKTRQKNQFLSNEREG